MTTWATDLLTFLARGRYALTPPALTDGATGEIQIDSLGRLRVVDESGGNAAITPSQYTAKNAGSGAIKTTPGKLIEINAQNLHATLGFYLLLFDLASVPSSGGTPKHSFYVPPLGFVSYAPVYPWAHTTGIVWVRSDTGDGYTLDVASPGFMVDAEYL